MTHLTTHHNQSFDSEFSPPSTPPTPIRYDDDLCILHMLEEVRACLHHYYSIRLKDDYKEIVERE